MAPKTAFSVRTYRVCPRDRHVVEHRREEGVGELRAIGANRACRNRLADEHGIAPYMVFHDSPLMEILEQQPTRESELLHINGVGETKLDKFGDDFIEVLKEYLDD